MKSFEIIVTKPFIRTGGVAEFVNSLEPFLTDNTIFFKRGKRKDRSKLSFLIPLIDIVRFLFSVIMIWPKKVMINSSLAHVGIVRDGAFIRISKLLGIETILYIHGFDKNALKRKSLLNMGYFKADSIFVLSSEFRNSLLDLGCSTPIYQSYNPVNNQFIQLPTKFKKSNQKKKILMISRIEKSKGIFIGLEVMKILKRMKIEDIELHIAGTGSALSSAKEMTYKNKLNNVLFHGFVSGPDKVELLRKCDILLFPTFHNEGLPINILESLVMGLWVISRPVAGIVDLMNDYHMDITKSKNPEDYAQIIRLLNENGLPMDEIKENQIRAKVDFSPETILNNIELPKL